MKRIINEKGVFDIRQAEQGDLDYILSSWQLTWERGPEMNLPGMIRDKYFYHAHLILNEIISRASKAGSLYVCQVPNQPHLIRGFLCAEVFKEDPDQPDQPEIAYLHWVQVKKKDWDQGVASALFEAFYADFDIQPDQNLLYTFTSRALNRRELVKKAQERYNLVAWPWFKYTSQDFGWEAG